MKKSILLLCETDLGFYHLPFVFGREVSSFPFCGRIPKEGKCIVSCFGGLVVDAFVFFRKAGEFEEEEVEFLNKQVRFSRV